jgi:DNA-binding MarR family transcriptional regulator
MPGVSLRLLLGDIRMQDDKAELRSFPPMLDWPYYWISRVNAHYAVVLEQKLKPLGINASRWRVLASLYERGSLGVSEIADFAILRLNTATKVVQKMSTEGFVQTTVNANDARITQVTLTEEGQRQALLARNIVTKIFETSFADVSGGDRERLNMILGRVATNLAKVADNDNA